MWGNFSQNPNDRWNLPARVFQFTFFMTFDTLVNLVKNWCTPKTSDEQYVAWQGDNSDMM